MSGQWYCLAINSAELKSQAHSGRDFMNTVENDISSLPNLALSKSNSVHGPYHPLSAF